MVDITHLWGVEVDYVFLVAFEHYEKMRGKATARWRARVLSTCVDFGLVWVQAFFLALSEFADIHAQGATLTASDC